ncbi:MAG: hypothetical protein KC996_02760 [Phycisphaerales bacterium]|nr:hypothetical protein [Phycisphaerales bacterium]
MSVHPGSSRPVRVDAQPPRLRAFTLSYPIARVRLTDAAPEGPSAVLELQFAVNTDGTGVRILDPRSADERSVVFIEGEPGVLWSVGGWMHVDIPSVLSCSIADADTDHAQLVYARTPILGELGIPGGRFDPPTLAFHD